MIVHRLDGCAPAPLASYLKALGILRLVGEQLDPDARGLWEGDRFVLVSHKTERELIEFFLECYSPTPVVAPWNKGSGFFAGDHVFRALESSTADRFAALRAGIAGGRAHIDTLSEADRLVRRIKAEATDKRLTSAKREAVKRSEDYKRRLADAERRFRELKADLIPSLRLDWRGPHREWLDAAMVVDSEGSARFPALLGTGGNDGRLDFTNNFFQHLQLLFDFEHPKGAARADCAAWLWNALFGTTARALVKGIPGGQFTPGTGGGANSGLGATGDARLNPVDFVLMLEGCVLFAATSNRRWDTTGTTRAAAPFAVTGHSAGYASASEAENTPRGEQWMPLWSGAASLSEVRKLLAEGRAQIRGRRAREPLDVARAVACLGVSRGIRSFQRFGFIERNGQSNFAVPLGRFVVPDAASPKLTCLDDLDLWLQRLKREARDKSAPARLTQAERRLADAVLAVTQHPDEPMRWQTVLLRLSDVEAIQITGSGYAAGPIPRLRPEWVTAADDGSVELRLAVTFALQAGEFERSGIPVSGSGVRRHWVSLDGGRYITGGTESQQRLRRGPDRVLQGRNGVEDAIALVARRLVEPSARGPGRLPQAAVQAGAARADLALFTAGEVNVDRTVALARALMALDGSAWARNPRPLHGGRVSADLSDDGWLAIRLATFPSALREEMKIGLDPAIARRLQAGDAASAVSLALRRLHAVGIRPALRMSSVSSSTARLWAAALAFPITQLTAGEFLARLDPTH